jgi:DNA-binding winged helix-turn-helix (wHTH) protein/tetratricopeptide (TPR) repeat protein
VEQQATVIAFGPFRLLPAQRQLWKDEEHIEVRPMPLAMLTYLAQHPERVVSIEELRQAVWGRTYVSRTTIRGCVRQVRQVLGDEAAASRYIETVGRQGYCFIGYSGPELAAAHDRSVAVRHQELATESVSLPTPFVGRQRELVQLRRWFAQAQQGQRQVVLVSGEPGIGKTTLLQQFIAQLPATGTVLVGHGQCVESYGPGEAYLPVLEALGRLGRELGAGKLAAVLQQHAPTWGVLLPSLVDVAAHGELHRQVAGATQERMLRELCDALDVLTVEQPLLLVLEDLQWSDTATLTWVAAVARRPDAARLFVIGTYRPTDVLMHTHPLRGLVQELRAHRLCREVRLELLSADEVREYVRLRLASTAAVDELGLRLHQRTDGNPLFLTASVYSLIQQGLVVEEDGRWVMRGDLAAIESTVPEDLQQLITKQIEALSVEEQQMLAVASVNGMTFTAAVVAAGCTQDPETLEEVCARLAQRGQMIEGGTLEEWPDGTLTARYGFRHALYQQVVYARLGEWQKVRLHRLLGERKEAAYYGHEMAVASELAVHFARGREPGKAVRYYQLAAEQALQRSAYQEALNHCQAGLALLPKLPEAQERLRQELALRLSLSTALTVAQDFTGDELVHNLQRAWELCEDVNDMPRRVAVLVGLTRTHLLRADRAETEELAEHERRLLAQVQNPALALRLHAQLATTETVRGAHARAQQHTAQVLALHGPASHEPTLGVDPVMNTLGVSGRSAWLAGRPADAVRRVEQGLARARETATPFSLTFTLMHAAQVRMCRDELAAAQSLAQQLVALAREYGFSLYGLLGSVTLGCIAVQAGKGKEETITLISSGLARLRVKRFNVYVPFFLAFLAQGYAQLGRMQDALATITEAIHLSETTLAAFWQAEAYRVKGEIMLQQFGVRSPDKSRQVKAKQNKSKVTNPQSLTPNPQEEAEACFHKAIEIARSQEAKSLELRAVMSLARLWHQQGKRGKAHQMLFALYHWFTEGLDTQDLQDAKALLTALS